jgi:import inner membrane translocase subunit TIM23
MGYLDRILGKQEKTEQQQEPEPEPQPAPSTSGPTPEQLIRDYAPTITAQPSSSMYNPYDGISDALGVRKAVFTLPEGPEFVFAEEASVKRRGWGENLYFYTGMGYVGGERRASPVVWAPAAPSEAPWRAGGGSIAP